MQIKHLLIMIFIALLANCSGDTKNVVNSDSESDVISNETDSSLPEYDIGDMNTPDIGDDQFVEDNANLDENENDQLVNPDQNTEAEIGYDQQDDSSVDSDESDTDQQVDPDESNPDLQIDLVEPDIDQPDQNGNDQNTGDDTSINQKQIQVATWPEGADTYIDDEFAGVTTFDKVVEFGDREFRFEKDGYDIHIETFNINQDTVQIFVVLQALSQVTVTFVSDPLAVECCIDHIECVDPYITPFTYEFDPNTDHFVSCSKYGYLSDVFDFQVGTEQQEVSITLQPIGFDAYCSWMGGTFEYIGGAVPPNQTVSTTVDIYEDHCMVCGLEPPAPTDVCLRVEYDPIGDMVYLICPDSALCTYILCIPNANIQVFDCAYSDDNGDPVNIQWHKIAK